MKKFWLLVLLFPAVLFSAPLTKPNAPEEFIRLQREDGKIESLEIAITRYEHVEKGITVDLVGVVHIGDKSYYKQLNKRLAKYDVVLYELVAPEGTKPGKRSDSVLAVLAKVMLDLDSQLAVIDYEKKNFVHADMSFDEMSKEMAKRGETGITIALSFLLDILRQQQVKKANKEVDLAEVIYDSNLLKQHMASQMIDNSDLGETLKKLLIDDRNKKACDVLDGQILAGKKNIAIFYGAAHNPDFDKRLRKDRKFVYKSQEWLPAWGNLNEDSVPIEIRLLKALLKK